MLHLITVNVSAQFREKYRTVNAFNSINGMSFTSPSTGFVAFNDFIGFTTDSGHTYIQRTINTGNTDFNGYSVNLTFGFSPSGVHAFSADSLLAYGDYGAEASILFSANQGQTWKLILQRDYIFDQSVSFTTSDMKFPGNGNIGIAVNDKDILRTTNKGQTWNVVAQLSEAVNSRFIKLSFPTPADGYAIAGNLLFKTINAGASWAPVSLPAGNTGLNFNNISFVTSNIGYISRDDDYTIYKTTNGGASWIKMNDETAFPVECRDMHFINDSTGFIATKFLYEVYKTTDHGVRWELCKRDPRYQNGYFGMHRLHFYNDQIGWAGGTGAYLSMTTNAGGVPNPKACYAIDTAGITATAIVHLNNCSKPSYQFRWYKNDTLISTTYNASYTHDFFNPEDTIKLIVSNGVDTDTLLKYQQFTLPPYKPEISSFAPASGSQGTFVTIYGSGFTDINLVRFGGTNASSFSVINDNTIEAIVAGGASGSIYVADTYTNSQFPGFNYFTPSTSPPPSITSITSAAGVTGTTVTITGNNFNETLSGNVVLFGSVKAQVITASVNQIVCKVPAGAGFEHISILNSINGLLGESPKPFIVTFADSSNFTGKSFVQVTQFDQGYYSVGEDIDGDGKPDLVSTVSGNSSDSIFVFRNTTTTNGISFGAKVSIGYIPKYGTGRFTIKDIDGDGKPDVLCATNNAFISISKNTSSPGSVSFTNQVNVATAAGTQDISIADLDQDGKNDIAVASYTNHLVSVIRNTSAPGFLSFGQTNNNYPTGETALRLVVGDLDNDGKKDLVALNVSYFSCFLNNSSTGTISLAPRVDFALPNNTITGVALALADYDNDNKLDVIIFNDVNFFIFKNTSTPGNITFADPLITSLTDGDGWGGCIASLSGDMKPDIITGTQMLFRNISTPGTIANEAGIYLDPRISGSINTADFNLDGKTDVIVSSPNTFKVSIFQNRIGVPVAVEFCAGGSAEIGAFINGSAFQWQQDTGTGFQNLTDNAYISGSNEAVINFTNLPSSWYGYKYRCKAGGNYSETHTIKFSNFWNQGIDTNWENPGNWSCGIVPDKNMDVFIPAGIVAVNSNAAVRSLTIKPGVSVTITPGFRLTVDR